MADLKKPTLKKEVYTAERVVGINDKNSKLVVELAFNNINGQFKVTAHVTTDQVSRTDEINEATVQQVAQMLKSQMEYGQKLRDLWGEGRDDYDGDEIPFPEHSDTPGNAKEADATMQYGFSEDTGDVLPDAQEPEFFDPEGNDEFEAEPAPSTKRKRK